MTKQNDAIELGKGGLRITWRGNQTLAEDCTNTQSGCAASLSFLGKEWSAWRKMVKPEDAASPDHLKEKFGETHIAKALDNEDWNSLAETFSATGRNHPTAKGAAYAYVRRKTRLSYSTLKTLKSREKNTGRKRRTKSSTDNHD